MNFNELIKIEILRNDSMETFDRVNTEKMFEYEFGNINIKWSNPKWYLLAKYNGNIIGRIGILKRSVIIENTAINILGLSGVIVIKDWRGKKILNLMMQEISEYARTNLKVDFGLLLCRNEVIPIYEKYKWYKVDEITTFSQPTGKIIYPKNTMVRSFSHKTWPIGPINLNGLPW